MKHLNTLCVNHTAFMVGTTSQISFLPATSSRVISSAPLPPSLELLFRYV